MIWHGYILLEKPVILTMQQWSTVLSALYGIWNKRFDDPQPARRLHYRLSLDNTKIIVEACFDTADLDMDDLQRLPKYISDALGGAFTPEQCCQTLQSKVTLWLLGDGWSISGNVARAYLAAYSSEWESVT